MKHAAGGEWQTLRRTFFALVLVIAPACGGDDDTEDDGSGGFGNADPNQAFGGAGSSGAPGFAGRIGSDGLPTACAQGSSRASRLTPRVILVLDGSCSMSTDYPSNGRQSATMCTSGQNTRWGALRRALLDPNDGVVTRLQGLIEFGLAIFGTQPMCPIPADPIQPALNNAGAIEAAFGNAPPGMFTPTGPALDWVYDNMIEPDMLDTDQGPQIVLLATDGEPNSCDQAQTNYQPSLSALERSRDLNVSTYVVSLAASSGEFHDHLQQLSNLGASLPANGGENAPLYEPTTPQQLAADLELLIGGAVGCDLALNGRVQTGLECQGRVTLNGQELGCNDPNGWRLVDDRHIRLEGDACDLFMSSGEVALQADFECSIFAPF